MKSPIELIEAFRARGLKITPQRIAIFRALHGAAEHPTADGVYDVVSAELPTISLGTVYQTLHELAEMGELVQLDLGTGSARFDPNVDHHHHLVCERCGLVRDLYADFDQVQIPAGAGDGFAVGATQIVFRGRCGDCATDTLTTDHQSDITPNHTHNHKHKEHTTHG